MTHTFATLEVSGAAYEEIKAKLIAAGYQHAIWDNVIDMHGIGLVRQAPVVQPKHVLLSMVHPSDDVTIPSHACGLCGQRHPPKWSCRRLLGGGVEVCRGEHHRSADCSWESWP